MKKKILVILEDRDIKVVQKEEALDGTSFSATLRKIIREWKRMNTEETVTIGGNGSTHEPQ